MSQGSTPDSPPLESLLLYGNAVDDATPSVSYCYKLSGQGDTPDTYNIVLEVTDGAQCSYASVFTLQQIYQQVEKDFPLAVDYDKIVGILKARMGWHEVATAKVTAAGGGIRGPDGGSCGLYLNLHEDKIAKPYYFDIRLPPQGAMAPLRSPGHAAWVTQELLFSSFKQLQLLEAAAATAVATATSSETAAAAAAAASAVGLRGDTEEQRRQRHAALVAEATALLAAEEALHVAAAAAGAAADMHGGGYDGAEAQQEQQLAVPPILEPPQVVRLVQAKHKQQEEEQQAAAADDDSDADVAGSASKAARLNCGDAAGGVRGGAASTQTAAGTQQAGGSKPKCGEARVISKKMGRGERFRKGALY